MKDFVITLKKEDRIYDIATDLSNSDGIKKVQIMPALGIITVSGDKKTIMDKLSNDTDVADVSEAHDEVYIGPPGSENPS